MNLNSLSRFVRAAGIYNLLLAVGMASPFVTNFLQINICDYALSLLIAAFLIFTAAVQVIAARDLRSYGWLIFWEGILRWMAAALLIPYGFFGHLGTMAGVIGAGDLIIGFVFLLVLPKAVGKSASDLALGRQIF